MSMQHANFKDKQHLYNYYTFQLQVIIARSNMQQG